MKRVPVESDMLSWIAYDAERRVLELGFTDGAVYRYFDVPSYIYTGLLYAKSHGQFFNDHIKPANFRYEKVQ
jgi:hypothetical protein